MRCARKPEAKSNYQSAAVIYERMTDRSKHMAEYEESRRFRAELARVLGPFLAGFGTQMQSADIASLGINMEIWSGQQPVGNLAESYKAHAAASAERARRCREGAARCP